MNTKHVTLAEAAGHLAELIEAAKRGEQIVIEDDEHTQVQLVMLPRARKPRVLGLHEGQVEIGKDFDEPLPEGFWIGGLP